MVHGLMFLLIMPIYLRALRDYEYMGVVWHFRLQVTLVFIRSHEISLSGCPLKLKI